MQYSTEWNSATPMYSLPVTFIVMCTYPVSVGAHRASVRIKMRVGILDVEVYLEYTFRVADMHDREDTSCRGERVSYRCFTPHEKIRIFQSDNLRENAPSCTWNT